MMIEIQTYIYISSKVFGFEIDKGKIEVKDIH